jgi:acetyl esterase/lipase
MTKNSKIHKELRIAAFVVKFVSTVSLKYFRLAYGLQKRKIGNKLEGFDCDQRWIARSQEDSELRIRIYRPKNIAHTATQKLPALLYFHGGGYALGVPEGFHRKIELFLQTRDCVVIAPDYRKSVDHPYPAALHDAYDALVWIKDNAIELGVRDDQIMVGGDSAGGGLTLATCLYARDQGKVKIAFQLPLYPMIDDRMQTPSATDNSIDPMWSSKANAWAWGLYLRGLKQKNLPIPAYAAPARATSYSNLPPAVTLVGGVDPFRDETIALVKALEEVSVPVKFKLYPGCFHGFNSVVPNAEVSKDAAAFYLDAFAHAVDNYFAEQTIESIERR